MKKSNLLITFLLLCTANLFAVVNTTSVLQKQEVEKQLQSDENAYSATSVDDFLDLTPRKIRKATGKKLSIKEVLVLKAAQKRIKKANKQDADGSKSQIVALILVILVGSLGIHRFYLGYTGIGVIQLLTLGGCGIWALIDLIQIAIGDLKPKDGSNYDPTL